MPELVGSRFRLLTVARRIFLSEKMKVESWMPNDAELCWSYDVSQNSKYSDEGSTTSQHQQGLIPVVKSKSPTVASFYTRSDDRSSELIRDIGILAIRTCSMNLGGSGDPLSRRWAGCSSRSRIYHSLGCLLPAGGSLGA